MRLWRIANQPCGWCLYRFQGCVITVAIFGKHGECGAVKPRFEAEDWWLRVGRTHCQRLSAERSARGPKDNAATQMGVVIYQGCQGSLR